MTAAFENTPSENVECGREPLCENVKIDNIDLDPLVINKQTQVAEQQIPIFPSKCVSLGLSRCVTVED